ncbi:flagellar hook capping protein [Nocardioides sp. GY 10113]|uniref:flagellar hook capping FlgD N-terminal domain-containing protein n=1 Tax=Nocardioides sp. GY 10113 TaxID=2569761 RepID=UPI0010A93482|nr:flagellar hook capping FlgD N-terminal domain-containing protein [Nocardioides sp. GY 10113]TIC83526.1 flagellar hook capping protein [Nocardioides sp. GY 10113]
MSVSGTESVTSPFALTGAAPTTSTSTTSASDDKQMFLELMVAQLRYQDPLNPTDSSEMLAQSAQFSALEAMQNVADQTALVATSTLAFGASGMIGKTVRWTDADGIEQTGTVQGATFTASGPVLSVDGHEVSLFSLTSVGDAPTITDPTDSSTDSSPDTRA